MKRYLAPQEIAKDTLDWCEAYYTCLGTPWMRNCDCYRLYGALCGEENKWGCEEPNEHEKEEIAKLHFARYVKAWRVYSVGGLKIALRRVAGEHKLPCDVQTIFAESLREATGSIRGKNLRSVDIIANESGVIVRAVAKDGSTLYEGRVVFECLGDRVRIRVEE